ncbi:MAG: GTPase Era [Candidatus Handelsmanbacteria bacterium RIFCSPLOWO2_12_FULL_64_10]|uniref:GTPase Era n=1 Tax=Handelsmanbacteria sp. (strain RIFCSPLOWO2_12_FULL_64_10) TaxID=1817868 RepID=A0A1F6C9K2_HANXR|nr:MAG: GTPase Era [Candidatus Handelsmanbacteria bacterium RIFCSPLOWO2_12_FULL_64_10]
MESFRSGDVAIVGRPNAGKSTLFNALVGERLAIVTPKPQTTRIPLLGVVTRPASQVVLWDTPGLLDPKYRLQEVMRSHAARRIREADAVVGLLDAHALDLDEDLRAVLSGVKVPLIVALNKIDLVPAEQVTLCVARVQEEIRADEVLPISALTGDGLAGLMDALERRLPFGPRLYPDETLTDQPERFFVAELIREAVFDLLREEVPYATAVTVEEFRERDAKTYIRANVCVERESQKGIVIGAQGRMLKRVGSEARRRIEAFLERPVYLDLWVKVREDWRKKDGDLRDFGYV